MKALRRLFSNINYLNLFVTIVGSAIVAFGTAIHVDSDTADGGIIGMSRIIEHFTDGQIQIWLSSLLINAFCYLLAWRLMDAKFILNMGVGTLTYSLFVKLFEPLNLNLEEYKLLATLVGMVFIEVGTGLMLRYGSAPNGEHVLSMAIAKKGDINFGWLNFIKDFIIILLFIPITDLESVIYSLLLMTLTTPITDYIVTAPRRGSMKQKIKKSGKLWTAILITGIIAVILFSIFAFYVNDYYHADTRAISNYNSEYAQEVETVKIQDDIIAYVPKGNVNSGFVFYPGGKVEFTSYEPLLKACADKGIVCVVVQMPQNLAIFGIDKGLDVIEHFPTITNWYIGGHSLGGSMAAYCASNNSDIFKGVILLGSYSTNDITNLKVLSVYGSEDKVMNAKQYRDNADNLPQTKKEIIISGGNHAYFGMYGEQEGDGTATITNVEQINQTAQYIAEFILN